MIIKKSIDVVVQISHFLKNSGFQSNGEGDGASVTMVDAENFVALYPNPSLPDFFGYQERETRGYPKAVKNQTKYYVCG